MQGRPSLSDPAIVKAATAACLEQLVEQVPDLYDISKQDDLVNLAHDLSRCLDRRDGYRVAKYLEDIGWPVDARVVAALDGDYLVAAHSAAVEHWVANQTETTPTLSRGTPVQAQVLFRDGRYRDVEGVILDIDQARAEYLVHVEGQADDEGYSVAYELVSRVEGEGR